MPPRRSGARRDGGETWRDLRDGLPQQSCYFTVLRQAMAGDTAEPAGVYFGTNSGSVFASRDEGENWDEIARAPADHPLGGGAGGCAGPPLTRAAHGGEGRVRPGEDVGGAGDHDRCDGAVWR